MYDDEYLWKRDATDVSPCLLHWVCPRQSFSLARTPSSNSALKRMMAAAWDVIQHYVKLPGLDQVSFGHSAVNVAPGTYGMIALFALALPRPWS